MGSCEKRTSMPRFPAQSRLAGLLHGGLNSLSKTSQSFSEIPSLFYLSVRLSRCYPCATRQPIGGGKCGRGEQFPEMSEMRTRCPRASIGLRQPGSGDLLQGVACTNPTCGFNIKIRNGDLYIDEPISS